MGSLYLQKTDYFGYLCSRFRCECGKTARNQIVKAMEDKASDSYGHVLKYAGVFGGVQGLNILVGLVRNKLVALLLGPNGMGMSSLFNATVTFISQATTFGLSLSAVKHVSELYDSGDEVAMTHLVKVIRLWSLLTAVIGMMVCAVVGPLLSQYTFAWGNHTLHFILLSPAVGLLAITGGETAILKGARQLRSLAIIQFYAVVAAFFVSVPVYYAFGLAGIVPVIFLMALITLLLTVRHSYKLYPLQLKGARGFLGEGMAMVRLGLAFVLAGVLGSGSEMLIRSYLNVLGDPNAVGLYNAGFMLTITYAGVVFSSMEADFFPRLSAVPADDIATQNLTINRQIEVSLLLVSPMLALLIVTLPIVVPLLFSKMFMPVVAMAQVSVFSMYLKSLSLPISYTNLARGNSRGYLLIETFYYVAFVTLIVWGYSTWGLLGTGVALVLSYAVELVVVYLYVHHCYHYTVSAKVMGYLTVQLLLGLLVYTSTFTESARLSWGLGLAGVLLSSGFSLAILRRKASLWNALMRRWFHRR